MRWETRRQTLIRRFDQFLSWLGLMRKSAQPIKEFEYDFVTGKIYMRFNLIGTYNRVAGWVCPTPDGPLKNIINPPNPMFKEGRVDV